jgi:ATP-dependent helicase Lhr and Lhr-like helicase
VSDVAIDAASWPALLSVEQLADDVLHSVNATEMARRHFREIARVAGLVFTGYPGAPHSMKQVQASSSLFYDVFVKYDTGNLLLQQARQEVLRQDCDLDQLANTLRAMAVKHWDLRPIARWTPFSFPLMVERLRERLSTSSLDERIEKMLAKLNAAATP